jgi:hypothetical protein
VTELRGIGFDASARPTPGHPGGGRASRR